MTPIGDTTFYNRTTSSNSERWFDSGLPHNCTRGVLQGQIMHVQSSVRGVKASRVSNAYRKGQTILRSPTRSNLKRLAHLVSENV